MDFAYFFRVINKRKWLILLVTALTIIVTYIIAGSAAKVYKSTAMLATGIVQDTGPAATLDDSYVKPYVIENKFSSLLESMTSRNVFNILSNELVIHDITAEKPFRDINELGKGYSAEALKRAMDLYKMKPDSAAVAKKERAETELLIDLPRLLGYDYESLKSALKIDRIKNTDFLKLEYRTEDPELSAFAVNSYCQAFIKYYNEAGNQRMNSSVAFFRNLVAQKQSELEERNDALKNYRLGSGVLNVDEESSSVLNQIQQLQSKLQEERSRIPSLQTKINYLSKNLTSKEQSFSQLQMNNKNINNLKKEINQMNAEYIAGGMKDRTLVAALEASRQEMDYMIANSTRDNSFELTAQSADLISQKMNAEIELEFARTSENIIQQEISRLQGRYSSFALKDARLTEFQREVELASREYLDAQQKLNEAEYASISSGNPLRQEEFGLPAETPEPSNSLFYAAFAGMLSFISSIVLLFLLAYIDTSVKTPSQFRMFTGIEPMGYLNNIKFNKLDLDLLFSNKSKDQSLETFKELLRKIRFEIESTGAQKVLVTSTKENEGKTFFIISLAYSLSLNDKRILLIDTNFKNNTLTEMLRQIEHRDLLTNMKLIGESGLDDEFVATGIISNTTTSGIDIIGSRGGTSSPSEIFAGKNFEKLLEDLALSYDYIFMEGASLNNYSDTKELTQFADKIIAIFSAKSEIKQVDRRSINYLNSLGDKFHGAILNQVNLDNL